MSVTPSGTNGSGQVSDSLRWPRPDIDIRDDQEAAVVPEELQWHVAYDQPSMERFVGEVEAERARLQKEIELTKARLERASAANVVRAATAQAAVGALVLAAQEDLAGIERRHQEVLETIRAAAVGEAARLLAAARAEADEVRNVATSMSARVNRRLHPSEAASAGGDRAPSADPQSDAR